MQVEAEASPFIFSIWTQYHWLNTISLDLMLIFFYFTPFTYTLYLKRH